MTATSRTLPQVFIALGSNLGDRLGNLAAARQAMPPEILVRRCSPIYETPPWGYLDQPAFLNQVVEAETFLDPEDLLRQLKHLEHELGRQHTFKDGPRQIDLDIIFFGDQEFVSANLAIPHPRLRGRAFVLVPLNDLAPEFVHPTLGLRVADLLAETDTQGIRKVTQADCLPA